MWLVVAVPEPQQVVILVVEELPGVQILGVSVAIDNVPAVLVALPDEKHIRTRGYYPISIKDVLQAPKMVQIGAADRRHRWVARGGVECSDGSIPHRNHVVFFLLECWFRSGHFQLHFLNELRF